MIHPFRLLRWLGKASLVLSLAALTIITYHPDSRSALQVDHPNVRVEPLILDGPHIKGLDSYDLAYVLPAPQHPDRAVALAYDQVLYTEGTEYPWQHLRVDTGAIGWVAPREAYYDAQGVLWAITLDLLLWKQSPAHSWATMPMSALNWSHGKATTIYGIGLTATGQLWLHGESPPQRISAGSHVPSLEVVYTVTLTTDGQPMLSDRLPMHQAAQLRLHAQEAPSSPYWSLRGGKVYVRSDTVHEWQLAMAGMPKPVFYGLRQDADHPARLLACESPYMGRQGRTRWPDVASERSGLWLSEDFGRRWQAVDSSVWQQWNEAVPVIPTNCGERIAANHKEEVDYAFFHMGLIHEVGWLTPDHYFLVGQHGLQVGRMHPNCTQRVATCWKWGIAPPDSSSLYQIYFAYDHIEWRINRQGIIAGQDTLAYQTFVHRVMGDSIEFVLAGSESGGIFRGKIPLEPPLTWRKLWHIVVHYHLVWVMWLGGIYWIFLRKK